MIKTQSQIEIGIALHVKRLRKDNKLSLDELANKTGISRATLSRIEKNDVSPTTQVLAKLCSAFELSLSNFMVLAESGSNSLIKANEQVSWRDKSNGFIRKSVSPPDKTLSGEIIECTLEANTSITYSIPTKSGLEHHLIMLEGKLALQVDEKHYELETGDCLRYKSFGCTVFKTFDHISAKYLLVLI